VRTTAIRAAMALPRLAAARLRAGYVRSLRRGLRGRLLPRHIGLIMDGNRRWARGQGFANPSLGHRRGAEHVEPVLGWCARAGIRHVTVYLCSTENLLQREGTEIAYLMSVIEEVLAERLARPELGWRVHLAGLPDLLPDSTARALKRAVELTRHCDTGAHLTLAVGYGGRREVVDAVRELLYERAAEGADLAGIAASLTEHDIARHLYTAGLPDPDLIIRTSGEQRMSNFLLWQSAHSRMHFCEAYWPAFRELDFLRALRAFAARDSAD
jgi:short-chain Z-isoprenyl diphosphate synthase